MWVPPDPLRSLRSDKRAAVELELSRFFGGPAKYHCAAVFASCRMRAMRCSLRAPSALEPERTRNLHISGLSTLQRECGMPRSWQRCFASSGSQPVPGAEQPSQQRAIGVPLHASCVAFFETWVESLTQAIAHYKESGSSLTQLPSRPLTVKRRRHPSVAHAAL